MTQFEAIYDHSVTSDSAHENFRLLSTVTISRNNIIQVLQEYHVEPNEYGLNKITESFVGRFKSDLVTLDRFRDFLYQNESETTEDQTATQKLASDIQRKLTVDLDGMYREMNYLHYSDYVRPICSLACPI